MFYDGEIYDKICIQFPKNAFLYMIFLTSSGPFEAVEACIVSLNPGSPRITALGLPD